LDFRLENKPSGNPACVCVMTTPQSANLFFWPKVSSAFICIMEPTLILLCRGFGAQRNKTKMIRGQFDYFFRTKQGCQMVCFQTKNPKFWRAFEW
jgi:hypothetical protein